MKSLLEVNNLNLTFEFNSQVVNAVKKSSFKIKKGECLAIVGESGSGKSVTALTIMRLIRSNSNLKISGNVIYENEDLLKLDESKLIKIRGKKISMIFQEPMTSLNPLHNIQKQITECFEISEKSNKSKCINLLKVLYLFDNQLNFGIVLVIKFFVAIEPSISDNLSPSYSMPMYPL